MKPPALPLENANARATAHAKMCGSTITIEVRIENDAIVALAGDIDACALGKAATAIVCTHIPGLTYAELMQAKGWLEGVLGGASLSLPPCGGAVERSETEGGKSNKKAQENPSSAPYGAPSPARGEGNPTWADLAIFEAARDIPLRHASVLLIFTALEGTFENLHRSESKI